MKPISGKTPFLQLLSNLYAPYWFSGRVSRCLTVQRTWALESEKESRILEGDDCPFELAMGEDEINTEEASNLEVDQVILRCGARTTNSVVG